jgi:ELWxxDGT repeat protein
MRKGLLLIILILHVAAISGQHYEQVFHVQDLDWEDRTLGQFQHLNRAAAVEIDEWWYFPAYTPDSGIDIWRTDLTPEGTTLFYDAQAPSPKFRWGNYLVYYEYDGEYYTLLALDIDSRQPIPLLQNRKWSFRESPVLEQYGNYLILAQGDDLVVQNLSALPALDVKIIPLPQYCQRLFDMGPGKVFAFTGAGSLLIDLGSGESSSFNEKVSAQVPSVRFAGRWKGRYYIQFEQTLYTEIYFIETDLSFGNVRYLDTMRNSNVLKITEEGAIVSNFEDGRNTIDRIALPSGQLQQRFVTHRSIEYSNWNTIEDLPDGGFLLSIDQQSEAMYVHFGRAVSQRLNVEGMVMDLLYSTTIMEEGVLIGYATQNEQMAEMFFFEYQSLNPRQILPEKFFAAEFGRTLKLVYAPLGGGKVMTLLYDRQTSYEPAVLDVATEEYYLLKDFNTDLRSNIAEIVFHQQLSNGMQIISVAGDAADDYTTVLFQPESSTIIDLKDWNNGQSMLINLTHQGFILAPGLSFEEYAAGVALVELNGLVYFIGSEQMNPLPGLYELDISSAALRRVNDLSSFATLFSTDQHLYLISSFSLQFNAMPREIYRLADDAWVLISRASEVTPYQSYGIQQFFYYDGYLYFSEEQGHLLAFQESSGQIDTIFKSITNNLNDPFEVTRYSNFVVSNHQLFFTASAHSVWLYWGIIFFGWSAPFDYQFLRTEGTSVSTFVLPAVPIHPLTQQYSVLNLFVWEGDVFLTLWPDQEPGLRSFRWTGSSWQQLQVYDNGLIQEATPAVISYFNAPFSRIKGYVGAVGDLQQQRIPLLYDGRALFYQYINATEGQPGQIKLSFFRYDGAIRLESEVLQPLSWFMPYITRDNFLIKGNKLISLQNADAGLSIIEYNFDTRRLREIVGPADGMGFNDAYQLPLVVENPVSGSVYFSSGPAEQYRTSRIYRLITCPMISAPTGIRSLTDSICFGDPWLLQMDQAEDSYRWLFVVVGGEEIPSHVMPAEGAYAVSLDLERGSYALTFYIDNGCEIIPLQTLNVNIVGERLSAPEIMSTALNASLVRYHTSTEADEYFWTVNNGTLLSGQGTPEVEVDWGATTFGWITLVVNNGFCGSAERILNYVVTSTQEQAQPVFEVFPNPAAYTFYIRSATGGNAFELRMFTLDGRLLESAVKLPPSTEWNVSSWPVGTYLLEFRHEQGVYVQKLSIVR